MRSRQLVGRSRILVRPQQPATSCAAVRRADGWGPKPVGVYRFWFRFPCSCFPSPSFSDSLFFCRVVARFFFGELYRCSTVSWPVLPSRWLSTGGIRRVGAADTGVPPSRVEVEGEGLWQGCPTGTCSTSGHTSGSGGNSAQNLVLSALVYLNCDRWTNTVIDPFL